MQSRLSAMLYDVNRTLVKVLKLGSCMYSMHEANAFQVAKYGRAGVQAKQCQACWHSSSVVASVSCSILLKVL